MKNIDVLRRTAQLAALGDARVADNPKVGAVLVHEQRILGEGYHRQAGQAHAEVNCLASVQPQDRNLIPDASLFISLEPCCVKGRTPACTGLILRENIRKVVFAQRDTTDEVSGRGAAILREAGVKVKEYPNFGPTLATNAGRRVYTTEERPYITLKFARSADGFLRPSDRREQYWITNGLSRRLVHRWRTQTNALIVGARTVLDDNPRLTVRYYPGPGPRPVVVDIRNRLTGKERLFGGKLRPIVFRGRKSPKLKGADVYELKEKELSRKTVRKVLRQLHHLRLGHVTVEGGAVLLQAFIEYGYWDEARIFTGRVRFGEGLPAPTIPASADLLARQYLGTDLLEVFERG